MSELDIRFLISIIRGIVSFSLVLPLQFPYKLDNERCKKKQSATQDNLKEKSQDTVFLISGGEDQEQFKSMWNYPAIDSTAVHEAYPGHHLQGVRSNGKPWMHQLPHIMYSPETLSPPYESQEGWATYCESMMHEKGFLGSDKHAFGFLDYSVGNACRMTSEIKLECEEATVDDMIDMTVKETGYLRATAEQSVKSFTRIPGYEMCYLSGWHLVNALKNDLRNEMGRQFSEKRFRDLIADNGNLPFYLLEPAVRFGMAADVSEV